MRGSDQWHALLTSTTSSAARPRLPPLEAPLLKDPVKEPIFLNDGIEGPERPENEVFFGSDGVKLFALGSMLLKLVFFLGTDMLVQRPCRAVPDSRPAYPGGFAMIVGSNAHSHRKIVLCYPDRLLTSY